MIILVDVDGVLADIHTVWLDMYNKEYHDNMKVSDIIRWEMHELVKPECGKLIYKYLDYPDFYKQTKEIEGAKEGVDFLRSRGYDVIFLTAGFYFDKIEWLREHGFSKDGRDVIITERKDAVYGYTMIDDYPKNLDMSQVFCKYLFGQPWNMDNYRDKWNWRQLVEEL